MVALDHMKAQYGGSGVPLKTRCGPGFPKPRTPEGDWAVYSLSHTVPFVSHCLLLASQASNPTLGLVQRLCPLLQGSQGAFF